jgi:hypothetical protein
MRISHLKVFSSHEKYTLVTASKASGLPQLDARPWPARCSFLVNRFAIRREEFATIDQDRNGQVDVFDLGDSQKFTARRVGV